MSMITLTNLTTEQCSMMDRLWEFDSKSELAAWVAQLPNNQQQMANTLYQMCIFEALEQNLQAMDRYPDAEAMLDRLKRDYLS